MYKKVECEIVGLSSNPTAGGAYALLLKEVEGSRQLPIIIGQFEAQAIAMELEGIKPPRPLTHDLIKSIIENAGASITEIIISELRENTFIAKIILEISSLSNEVDARPSDAIAIALRAGAPIYVAESVMEVASFLPSKSSDVFSSEIHEVQHEKPKEPLKTKEARISALQNQLREALESEDYERAAKLRDEIKRLSSAN